MEDVLLTLFNLLFSFIKPKYWKAFKKKSKENVQMFYHNKQFEVKKRKLN